MGAYRKTFGYGFTLLVILAIISLAVPVIACDGGWYDSGWSHRKTITIDHTKVVSDQKDFPVMINIGSDSDLASYAQATAGDLVFTLSDGTTKIPCKIESYTNSNGNLVAWVKVPAVSSSADTKLYMYYGNHGVSNQQDTSAGTWTDTYKGNWRKRDIISWVQTEYNNHNNPSSFSNRGSDETVPQAVPVTPTPTPTPTPVPTVTPADSGSTQTQQWSDCGWSYRRPITIDHTKVVADQMDFPVLISLTSDPGLAGHAQVSGNDILFTLSDEKTKVPHRIESFTSSNGALVAWVKVPSLSSSVNTVLYMYYGNPTVTSQQDTTGSWSYRFKGSWSRKAIESWVKTKYNNQMNSGSFYSLGAEFYAPQSCSSTPVPTAEPASASAASSAVTPVPTEPAVETTVTATPTPTETPVVETPTATPTPEPTPPFACPAGDYNLVTADGELSGCVAITNDWDYNETVSNLPYDTLYVTFTAADSTQLTGADVGISTSMTPVTPQYSEIFDPASGTTSYTFTILLPDKFNDVTYLYVTASGTVQKVADGVAPADLAVSVPENPIEYMIMG